MKNTCRKICSRRPRHFTAVVLLRALLLSSNRRNARPIRLPRSCRCVRLLRQQLRLACLQQTLPWGVSRVAVQKACSASTYYQGLEPGCMCLVRHLIVAVRDPPCNVHGACTQGVNRAGRAADPCGALLSHLRAQVAAEGRLRGRLGRQRVPPGGGRLGVTALLRVAVCQRLLARLAPARAAKAEDCGRIRYQSSCRYQGQRCRVGLPRESAGEAVISFLKTWGASLPPRHAHEAAAL